MERIRTRITSTPITRRMVLMGFAGAVASGLLHPVLTGGNVAAAPPLRMSPRVGPLQEGSVTVLETGSLGGVEGIGWSPDSARLAAFANGGEYTVLLYGRDGTLLQTLAGHTDFVRTVAWSSDGALLATGALDAPAGFMVSATLARLDGSDADPTIT